MEQEYERKRGMEGERESYPITRACVRTLTDKLSQRI